MLQMLGGMTSELLTLCNWQLDTSDLAKAIKSQ